MMMIAVTLLLMKLLVAVLIMAMAVVVDIIMRHLIPDLHHPPPLVA